MITKAHFRLILRRTKKSEDFRGRNLWESFHNFLSLVCSCQDAFGIFDSRKGNLSTEQYFFNKSIF